MDTNEGSNRVLENSFNYWFFNENLSSCTWECMNVMNCFQFFFLKMDFPFKCHQSRIKTENEVTTRRWKYYKKLSEMDKRLIESKFWFYLVSRIGFCFCHDCVLFVSRFWYFIPWNGVATRCIFGKWSRSSNRISDQRGIINNECFARVTNV